MNNTRAALSYVDLTGKCLANFHTTEMKTNSINQNTFYVNYYYMFYIKNPQIWLIVFLC